ncbi:hypothetical protein TYRP_021729 [Tyrophagus putrescentiae]|nr:hypothetical protein TYRP_021729 [Tyrophagus putrescentiae]
MHPPTTSRIAGKSCLICGDRASAFNFNGLSVRVIFFRRNAFRRDLKCPKVNACQLDCATRKSCPSCRIQKCLAIGMRKELIFTRSSPLSKATKTKSPPLPALQNDTKTPKNMEVSREEAVFFQGSTLNAHELELIGELEAAMGVFADENSMRLIGQVDDYSVAFNLYGRYIRPVVRFCKAIPAFKALDQEDMLVVLKPFYAEIISVRTAFLYDRSLDGFRILVNDWERVVAFVPMDCYRGCRLFDIETYCRNFLGLMNGAMEGDPVLRNLILAQNLFLQRGTTKADAFIREQHLVYCRLIRRYLTAKYRSEAAAEQKFSSLMVLLSELHFIRQTMRAICQQTGKEKLDVALVEVYDL